VGEFSCALQTCMAWQVAYILAEAVHAPQSSPLCWWYDW
jgi:hypothetical protein